MPVATYVDRADMESLRSIMAKGAHLDAYAQAEQALEAKHKKRAFWLNIELVAGLLVCAVVYVVAHAYALRARDPIQFEWYAGKKRGEPLHGKYGRLRGPAAAGPTSFSMMCVAVAQAYPALYGIAKGVRMCGALHSTSAKFLMVIAQVLHKDLMDIHWSGSAAQLDHRNLQSLLASYAAWDVPANKWRFLYTSESGFETAVAVISARKKLAGSYLDSLFRGGLCLLAVEQWNADDDEVDMCKMLLGTEPVYFRSCYAQKLAAGVTAGATGAVGAYAGMSVVKHGLQKTMLDHNKFLAQKGYKNVKLKSNIVNSKVDASVKRRVGDLGNKIKSKLRLGKRVGATTDGSADAAGLAARTTVGRKVSETLAKSTVGRAATAARAVGTKVSTRLATSQAATAARAVGSKVMEKTGAAAAKQALEKAQMRVATSVADKLGTRVAMEAGIAGAADAGSEVGAAMLGALCGPFAPFCSMAFVALDSIAMVVMLATAVGAAIGANAAANFKCPGGQWYTLERGPNGQIVTKAFAGDPNDPPPKEKGK